MKVASSYQVQQVNWQQVANKRQQRLEDAAKGRMLKELREDQQFEIYQAKGRISAELRPELCRYLGFRENALKESIKAVEESEEVVS